ncbi:cellulose binding domain-containing protein [Plantactinospora sp. B5E13]|uniref:glucuronyl esterase domain-containing protein n=1 Tax=unclassified Plantactinospora TaxID=2631981 RepID=UPI00325D06E7
MVAKSTVAEAAPGDVVLAASTVEDEGADCPVNPPGSLPSSSRLPDPFRKFDGSRITSKADWRCRRAETRELAERYVYGDKPAKPATVSGTVSSSSITVNVSQNGRSASFSASVQLPSGTGPFPAVIVYGGFGADTATIRSAGAAVINYDPFTVGREGTPRNNKQGAFYTIYGNNSSTGLLMAWAWGVSRIIDVIQQSGGNVLRTDIGVTGCSRYGKGAFTAGVFDQRVALTMPIESGSAGVPAFRAIAAESGAQPLSSAYGEQPWLGDAFGSYTGNPNGLPVDTHQMVGMVAPRGLFIMENPHVDWLGSRSGSVAALGGAEIYKALGAGENISYWSDVQDGTHCATRNEWRTPLQQNIQKFLVKTGNAAGVFRISSRKAGNLAEWRDWTTPTLADGPTNPPTTPPTGTPTTPPVNPTTPPATPPTVPPTTPPAGGAGCAASMSVNQWNGGFVATVRVTAGSAPVTGWTVALTLPSGVSVTNAWNVNRSGNSGAVQFTNVGYNGSIAAGQSTEFGFQGTGTGTGLSPTCTAR